MTAKDVLQFWFQECTPQQWFSKDEKFDESLRKRFLPCYEQAARGELFFWRKDAEGRLAEIIVLDQFARNMFRDSARCFAADPMALTLAQEAVARGEDLKLPMLQRSFLYMPYMHSESMLIHQEAIKLFSQPGLEENLKYEYLHLDILKKFGRYPHRNKLLGRSSTSEELEFLKQPGSSF